MDKEKFFKEFQDKIFELSMIASKKLANNIKKLLESLTTEGGVILNNSDNKKIINKIGALIKKFYKDLPDALGSFLFKASNKLFNINVEYFSEITKKTLNIDKFKKAFYDFIGFKSNGSIIENGQVFNLLIDNRIFRVVNEIINVSIKKARQIKDVISKIIDFIAPKIGLGATEKQLITNGGFDFLQRQDRELSYKMAVDLGLNYAVYAGTIKDTTRDFCKQRVNRVYTKDFIQKWDNLTWNGKKKDQNSLLDCGGWGCRHHLNWVTEQAAKDLTGNKKINSYNN